MTRLRSQAGFTLVELLAAMIIGMFTILAAFALIDAVFSGTAKVQARTDASQRGRLALDNMTRALRSQVCVNGAAPILSADADQVTFTADLSASSGADKYQLAFNQTAGTFTQTVTKGVGNEPSRLFTGTVTTTRVISDVVRETGKTIFTYWSAKPGTGGSELLPLTAPLAAADLKRVVRIDIAFVARSPKATKTENWSSAFEDSVTARLVDTTIPDPSVVCK
jgi:type II secretory pathway pseudopilin PulG